MQLPVCSAHVLVPCSLRSQTPRQPTTRPMLITNDACKQVREIPEMRGSRGLFSGLMHRMSGGGGGGGHHQAF